jgi:hypothetical protein
LQYSASKCFELACKVLPLLLAATLHIVHCQHKNTFHS